MRIALRKGVVVSLVVAASLLLFYSIALATQHSHGGTAWDVDYQCDVDWGHNGPSSNPSGTGIAYSSVQGKSSCDMHQSKLFYYLTGFGWQVVNGTYKSVDFGPSNANRHGEYSSFYQHACGNWDIYGEPTCAYAA